MESLFPREHFSRPSRQALSLSPPPPPPPAVIYLWSQIAFFDSAALGADLELKVRWAADIVLQLTAACSFVAFSDEKVLAR